MEESLTLRSLGAGLFGVPVNRVVGLFITRFLRPILGTKRLMAGAA
jgi:hypothetical protein